MTAPDPTPATAPRAAGDGGLARPRTARRDDLDGLRAVAILLVAVYHVWVHRVSGGVDVFLMLSGFFVAGGLVRGFGRGRPVELRTYLPRLARRLVPALAVVLAAVVVAAVAWLPRTRWSDLSAETLASLGYVQNWRLALAGQTYGAADVTQSPLQHVWSMSVQGQLFVGLPLLLLAVWWCGRRLQHRARLRLVQGAVLVLAVASAAYAVVTTRLDQPFAYYDTLARAWEYLAGALLAMALTRARVGTRVGALLGWLGLVVVLAAGVLVDGGATFPGPASLVPVGGAALVVLAGAPAVPARWSATRLLAWRPLARAGGYAYGFYLWHWPVLVFAIVLRDRPVGWLAGSGVLVLSAVLAWATKRYVEDPWRSAGRTLSRPLLRRARRGRTDGRPAPVRPGALLVGSLAVLVCVVPTVAWSAHTASALRSARTAVAMDDLVDRPGALSVIDPLAFPVDATIEAAPSLEVAPHDKVRAVFDGCGVNAGESEIKVCRYGDLTADRVVAVVGGSHAEFWVDALAAIGEEKGFRVDSSIRWACSLIDGDGGVEGMAADPACVEWSAATISRLERERPDVVFTTATRPDEQDGTEQVPEAYRRAWEDLESAGIPVVAVRDTPWLPVSPLDCLAVHGSASDECAVQRTDVLADVDPTAAIDAETSELIRFVDLNDIVCADDVCRFVQGNRVVYRDQHHLTASYVATLAPILRDRLQPILGWW